MKKFIFTAAVSAGLLTAFATAFAADVVLCEEMLKSVQAASTTAKLSEADKAAVADLQMKGTERCNADDDAGADTFFADALKLLGK